MVAKTYVSNFYEEYKREVLASKEFQGHENITTFETNFKINNHHINIMPLYASSLFELISENTGVVDDRSLVISNVAKGCFDALEFIHSKDYCFSDFKPHNIMLNSEVVRPVLIDFAAAVKLGSQIKEITKEYCRKKIYILGPN